MQDIGLRLSKIRRENKLSQEALAEKLGLSRQAVSKWERGECAPDTENLIALSKIYGITLDELLNGESDFEKGEDEPTGTFEEESGTAEEPSEKELHEKEKRREKKKAKPEKVKKARLFPKVHSVLLKIPVIIIVPLLFVIIGVLKGVWSPLWLINLLIPIYYGFVHAFGARSKKSFLLRLPVFFITVGVFLTVGFLWGKWHPAWMVFFVDIIYYWVALFIKSGKK